MDNQHRKISGYRELNETEISLMNELKHIENQVGNIFESVRVLGDDADQRALAIARTHLQTGFMWAVRAIAQPESELNPSR